MLMPFLADIYLAIYSKHPYIEYLFFIDVKLLNHLVSSAFHICGWQINLVYNRDDA